MKTQKMLAVLVSTIMLLSGSTSLCLVAEATNTYSDIYPYVLNSTVYYGAYARNLSNNSTDFLLQSTLYNNVTNQILGGGGDDVEYNVGYNIQTNLINSFPKSNCASVTRINLYVGAYGSYHQYANPYETYSNTIYYYK